MKNIETPWKKIEFQVNGTKQGKALQIDVYDKEGRETDCIVLMKDDISDFFDAFVEEVAEGFGWGDYWYE